MPTDTIIVICGAIGAFVFFAGMLAFADLTWSKAPPRRQVDRR